MIQIENLAKRYVIRQGKRKKDTDKALGESLANISQSVIRRISPNASVAAPDSGWEEFWALRDINLTIEQGEVVGLIGSNGAGKSTLLKVLSRITAPTEGRIVLDGRVASLLEVGTGFHPELTGRENIYLNGAILGMTRAEIKRNFDEIVAFAEIERFLEVPVKRYSSGMYVRLAFAIAAHLEPEILIVDEVLAVGDLAFQRKCLGKMDDVAQSSGRTVIFVSHNMGMVRALCQRGIYLKSGSVVMDAPIGEVIEEHQRAALDGAAQTQFALIEDEQHGVSLQVERCDLIREDEACHLEAVIRVHATKPYREVGVAYEIVNPEAIAVTRIHPKTSGIYIEGTEQPQRVALRFDNIDRILAGGDYAVNIDLMHRNDRLLHAPGVLRFSLVGIDPFGNGTIISSRAHGPVILCPTWQVAPASDSPQATSE